MGGTSHASRGRAAIEAVTPRSESFGKVEGLRLCLELVQEPVSVGAVMVTSTRVALSPSIPRSAAMAGSRCGASTSAGSAFGARAGIASFRCTWASHDHRAVAVRSDLRREFCDIGVGGRAVAPDIERGRYRAWRHGPYPDRRAERSVLGPHRGAAPLETASIEAVSQDDAAARWMPSRNAPAKATHVSDL
jgi:hypothetical protein